MPRSLSVTISVIAMLVALLLPIREALQDDATHLSPNGGGALI
jgi:hypothetical protein